jgi:hypothetical protein
LLTLEFARCLGKPHLIVDLEAGPDAAAVRAWIAERGVRVLNVAGPRESESPGLQARARALLEAALG